MKLFTRGMWLVVVGVGSISLTLASGAQAAEPCSSCGECETKLASGTYPVVQLAADITDHAGTCISLGAGVNNVEFDCNGHTIDGDELATAPVRGISLMHVSGITVKNCTVSDFESAIYLVDATAVTISDNVIVSNRIGIDLSNADSNEVRRNEVSESSTGIKISNSDNNTFEDNTVCDNFPWTSTSPLAPATKASTTPATAPGTGTISG